MPKLLLLVLLNLLLFFNSYAQSVIVKNIAKEGGLPSNKIYNINTDSKGYLWICSDKGLARYNGRTFETFTTSDGLPDNEVFSIKEDYEHRLWIASFKGILCYFQNGIFHTASNTPWLKLPLKSPTFWSPPRLENDSSLLMAAGDGKYALIIKHNSFRLLDLAHADEKEQKMPRPFFVVKFGSGHFRVFYPNQSFILDSSGNVLKQLPYKRGTLYIGASSGDDQYIYSKYGIETTDGDIIKNTDKIPFDFKMIATLSLFKHPSNTFIATEKGLFLSDYSPIIKDIPLTSVTGDKDGNIWAGSSIKGIFCVSKDFRDITNNTTKLNAIAAKKTKEGLFFVAEDGNYYKVDHEKVTMVYNNKLSSVINFIDRSRVFITDDGNAVVISRAGDIGYYSTKDKSGIPNIYIARNNKNGAFIKYPISWDIQFKYLASIKNILEFDSYIYISTISTISRIKIADLTSGKPAHRELLIDAKNDNEKRIYDRGINPLDSSLWFARADGMFSFKNGKIVSIKEFSKYSFRQFKFFKNYLIGVTDENKLLISNTVTGSIDSFPNEDDCIWENIYPIDGYRAIINTNNYYRMLTLYPPNDKGKPVFSSIIVENPFLSRQASYIATDTGNCYFFNNGNITTVKNSLLFEQPEPPKPVFLSLKTNQSSYVIQDAITIPYNESKTISLKIDNISFVAQRLITEYSISNTIEEDHWSVTSGTEINLNTPSYGKYFIKLRSKTFSSNYSKPAVINLIIKRPYWATWWFITISALVLILFVYGIVVYFIGRNLRKKQKEHDADMKYQQSEYKALNALMNPHFIFNSLNNIQSLINQDEKLTANQYLVIFSKLIRQNMHNISQGFISLHEELLLVENYLDMEKLRFKELVNYKMDIDDELEPDDIMIPPLMIQPLVENAVKHGLLPRQSTQSMVWVKVYEKEDVLYIEILDNGIGLTKSFSMKNKLHKSYGLTNLQKRVEHLKKIQQKDINIEVKDAIDADGNLTGTIATIIMQLE